MKTKIVVFGLVLIALAFSPTLKRIFIPADPLTPTPPVAQLIKGPCPFGGPTPPMAAKVPNYFPPFPPPVEYKPTVKLA